MSSENTKFDILIASQPDREEVVVEIYADEKYVALISQDQGPNQLLLELPGPGLAENMVTRSVDLDGFLSAIDKARKRLLNQD